MASKQRQLEFVCPSLDRSWIGQFAESLRFLFSKDKLPDVAVYRPAEPDELTLGPLVLDSLSHGWIKSRREAYRVWKEERGRPALRLSSRPAPVKTMWGAFHLRRRGPVASGLAHAALVAVLILAAGPVLDEAPRLGESVTLRVPVKVDFPDFPQVRALAEEGGGGGGGRNKTEPPSRGRPARFAPEQILAPSVETPNPDAALAVTQTINVPQLQLAKPDETPLGVPWATVLDPSSGPGMNGIGTGRNGGIGPDDGDGLGPGTGGNRFGGVYRIGGDVSAPSLIYKEEPEYSEEARKSKYQGKVTLAIEVWPDGRAHNIYVIRGLGLGLDEKAMDAVRNWKFRPAQKAGEPVKVSANVEVNFRLL